MRAIGTHVLEWLKLKQNKTDNTEWWQECRVTADLIHCWWECKVAEPVGKRVQSFHIKINKDKLTIIMQPNNPILRDLPEWSEAYIHKPVTQMFTVT